MIKIKKLHLVHKYYPNVPRRWGKTTYCFDALLRAAQTGKFKRLVYVTNTQVATNQSLYRFMEFLSDNGEQYLRVDKTVILTEYDVKIYFHSAKSKTTLFNDGIIEDYYNEV